jgi:hypothetical protein
MHMQSVRGVFRHARERAGKCISNIVSQAFTLPGLNIRSYIIDETNLRPSITGGDHGVDCGRGDLTAHVTGFVPLSGHASGCVRAFYVYGFFLLLLFAVRPWTIFKEIAVQKKNEMYNM